MATQNLVSVERDGLAAEKAETGRAAYRSPEVVGAGTAIKLVQGPMMSTYRDAVNSGWTYWPQ
jgi:hypothetical protein